MSYRSESTGRELGITPVRGVRAFVVDEDGTLRGATGHAWVPGENVAECLLGRDHDGFEGEASPATDPRHCECGFYAYAEGVESRPARERSRFAYGVVEGYGLVSVGSKGFKAQRARIVGLAVEPRRGSSRLVHVLARASERDLASFGSWFATLVVGLASLAMLFEGYATSVRDTYPFSLVPTWVVATLLAVVAVNSLGRVVGKAISQGHSRDSCVECVVAAGGEDPRSRVAENYPDVPVFATVEELLAALPPDPAPAETSPSVAPPPSGALPEPEFEADADRPADPRPSTDPDFWTRPAGFSR